MGNRTRVLLLIILLVVLAGAAVAFGSVEEVPQNAVRFQDSTESITEPSAHIGEKVVVDGSVISLNPMVVRVANEHIGEITVTGHDSSELTTGSQIYVFGTLTSGDTVAADRVVAEPPWANVYMYTVSLLGGLIVLAQSVRYWRFDFHRRVLAPRSDRSIANDYDD
jgi:hypothetical protein